MSQRIFGQVLLLVVAASLAVGLVGCGKSGEALPSSPTHETKALNPPDESFARTVGVTTGPVTAQPAKAIAAAAAGGVAIAVEQEDEDGTQIFGVLVKAGKIQKEVKVRISDGAVTRIAGGGPEEGDGDEGDGDGGNGEH